MICPAWMMTIGDGASLRIIRCSAEAIALLAGDALLTRAFYLLTRLALPGDVVVNIVAEVAQAVGSEGLIGGQVVDLQSEGKQVDRATLEYIHCHKTGDLIAVALRTGAMVGGAGEELLASFDGLWPGAWPFVSDH